MRRAGLGACLRGRKPNCWPKCAPMWPRRSGSPFSTCAPSRFCDATGNCSRAAGLRDGLSNARCCDAYSEVGLVHSDGLLNRAARSLRRFRSKDIAMTIVITDESYERIIQVLQDARGFLQCNCTVTVTVPAYGRLRSRLRTTSAESRASRQRSLCRANRDIRSPALGRAQSLLRGEIRTGARPVSWRAWRVVSLHRGPQYQ